MGEIIREYVPFPDPGAPINKIFFLFKCKATFYTSHKPLSSY